MNRRQFLQTAAAVGIVRALTRRQAGGRCEAAESPATAPIRPTRAFSFLHSYEATGRYWRGIEKAGLLRSTNGVRLVNSPFGDDDARRFNNVARVGGPLHQIMTQRRCPFVIDRVAGGSPYRAYDFDGQLVAAYASLLGDRFLGGQVHETVCNTHNDWKRLVQADGRFEKEPVQPDALRARFNWNDAAKWLEYGTLDDYAGRLHPRDEQGWWKEIERQARRQAARFGSRFSYCEGSTHGELTWHAFYRFGAAYGLAEVGVWASAQTQFAIAALRGAAKAAERPWGVFFAPWGPRGCTCFIPEKDWSWQCSAQSLNDSQWPVGPDLGCSSALQRRIFFHAYLSGANTLHEEWGAECNLTDWDSGTLSSYGRVTRDLLDFQEKHPDVGKPYTPVALAMNPSIPPSDSQLWAGIKKALFQYGEADKANATRRDSGENEVACYAPCIVPEVFDIVPANADDRIWTHYKEVINVGAGRTPRGARRYPSEELPDRIIRAIREHSPLARSSHMPTQINFRQSDRAWIIAIYNPWGAGRGQVDSVGSTLNRECTQQDVLRPTFAVRSARAIHAWPSGSGMTVENDGLHVTVGPGGTLILEILGR